MLTVCNCSGSALSMSLTATDKGGRTGSSQVVVYVSDATTSSTTTTTYRCEVYYNSFHMQIKYDVGSTVSSSSVRLSFSPSFKHLIRGLIF
ncbi:hypothetical protein DPMN_006745 [Dreissena polymorpha]|uniref:Uncharacterized protein n=1 Tax=Dreissena polymorpha TaxID=45954 RepID=A0A9D4MSZ6_DREPO|nr:hypothetical protein DPMN_006745 [Dreissena polymorpha]